MTELGRKRVEHSLLPFRDSDMLILKDKVGTADNDPLALHSTGNAVRHQILHLRVHLLVVQSPIPCRLHHGVGHGVGEVLLQAGSKAQHLRRTAAAKGNHPIHHRRGMGQGAGLIKDDGIRLCHPLKELAALDGHVIVARLPDGRQNRQRHGQLQRAGEVHHQHGQRPGSVAGQQPYKAAGQQRVGHQAVGQVGSLALR